MVVVPRTSAEEHVKAVAPQLGFKKKTVQASLFLYRGHTSPVLSEENHFSFVKVFSRLFGPFSVSFHLNCWSRVRRRRKEEGGGREERQVRLETQTACFFFFTMLHRKLGAFLMFFFFLSLALSLSLSLLLFMRTCSSFIRCGYAITATGGGLRWPRWVG